MTTSIRGKCKVKANHGYEPPISAQVILGKGRRELDLNEIEFRNFRRFGSTMKILDTLPVEIH